MSDADGQQEQPKLAVVDELAALTLEQWTKLAEGSWPTKLAERSWPRKLALVPLSPIVEQLERGIELEWSLGVSPLKPVLSLVTTGKESADAG